MIASMRFRYFAICVCHRRHVRVRCRRFLRVLIRGRVSGSLPKSRSSRACGWTGPGLRIRMFRIEKKGAIMMEAQEMFWKHPKNVRVRKVLENPRHTPVTEGSGSCWRQCNRVGCRDVKRASPSGFGLVLIGHRPNDPGQKSPDFFGPRILRP